MNTVEFLFSLENKHTYFVNGISDLQLLFCDFDKLHVKVLEKEFTSVCHLKKEEFLMKLESDLEKLSLENVHKLSDLISLENNVIGNSLTNIIRKFIYHYAVKNKDFDLSKYYKVVSLGVIVELEKKLYSKICLTFGNSEEGLMASCDDNYSKKEDKHYFGFYMDPSIYKNREELLFEILVSLYHEFYHASVSELNINPNCYKLDILEYQKYRTIKNNAINGRKFYFKNYEFDHEEAEAYIFSIREAYRRIKELNQDFNFNTVNKNATTDYLFANMVKHEINFKIGLLKRINQKVYIDNELDNLLINNSSEIYGLLTKVYNKDGSRKNLIELINDYEMAINTNQDNKDILPFYTEIVINYLKKYPLELENYKNDENIKKYIDLFYQMHLEYLSELLFKLNKESSETIGIKIKKAIRKENIKKEINNIKKIYEDLRKEGFSLWT